VTERTNFSNWLKNQAPFNIEKEIAKLKIYIPLTELVKKNMYMSPVLKVLNIGESTETVNLNDD